MQQSDQYVTGLILASMTRDIKRAITIN